MGVILHRWTLGQRGFIAEASLAAMDPAEAKQYMRGNTPVVELTDVYTHPLRRGRGWARSCAQAALDYADDNGWDVFLRVVAYGPDEDKNQSQFQKLTNEELAAFYKSLGFKARADDPRSMMRRYRARRSKA